MARPVTALAPLKQNQDQIDESGQYAIQDGAVKPLPAAFASGNNSLQANPPKPKTRASSNAYSAANGDIQLTMKTKVVAKWGEEYWPAMHYILDHESGGNPHAINKSSGACGIPQALPCSKLLNVIGSLDNIEGQLDWMVNYIAQRYSDPIKAMNFHLSHNWY